MPKDENYLICRCEEISLKEIKNVKNNGLTTSQEIKMATRAGMGVCQGRICRSLIEQLVAETEEGSCKLPSKLTVHHPVRPVPLGMIVNKED
ncbi:(2Fe-2S)-binding protein [Pseudogracilibacillus auburnensis]|uniref:BFD-like [2Fe-2S] binding protein n=1 Tax=Pseudogracilibacillus auburnensis TaxID=1494959 RepID=A0A2V3W1V0_9BACI|nr:(2Fe-2S)-binding protein [Pseudogracilibacillus auburnensis]PXW87890.1 BFD-like [2Fe-2S] binding protein [Pseudogracilibacillus auburnensis]